MTIHIISNSFLSFRCSLGLSSLLGFFFLISHSLSITSLPPPLYLGQTNNTESSLLFVGSLFQVTSFIEYIMKWKRVCILTSLMVSRKFVRNSQFYWTYYEVKICAYPNMSSDNWPLNTSHYFFLPLFFLKLICSVITDYIYIYIYINSKQ